MKVLKWAWVICIVGAACDQGDSRTSELASGGIQVDGGADDADAADGAADDEDDQDEDDDEYDDEGFDPDPGGTGDWPGGCPEGACSCPSDDHEPCDAGTDDLLAAMGLGCPGEVEIDGSLRGGVKSRQTRSGFGDAGAFAPREGERFAVLSTGRVADLGKETPNGDYADYPTYCNSNVGNSNDIGKTLPAPMKKKPTSGDCEDDPSLIGTGDCSSSIKQQLAEGGSINDYSELRFTARVPEGVTSIAYDFAFFSTEYPSYVGQEFNDMFIGWLQSEEWTGNISFDEQGQPISLNAGFLDFKDDGGTLPELAGTCMRQHAGTKWLSTTAPVTPGEDSTLVLAVFDLSDSILDSYVFLDNFGWGCEGTDTPETKPVG